MDNGLHYLFDVKFKLVKLYIIFLKDWI